MSTPSTWLLLDDKASHRSQVTGVAERLGFDHPLVKEIRYNGSSKLANRFFGARLWHLGAESRKTIEPPWPDLVIAAGRRAAPVALAVKARSPGTKLVHLMWPDMSPKRFDLIAVPEHDSLSYKGPNLLRTFGAPNAVSHPLQMTEAERWQAQVSRLPSPRIAVLIGGESKSFHYMPEDFKTLGAYISAEAERLDGSLLITTSPRTGEEAEKKVKALLTVPNLFHRYQPGADNPYRAFLGLADIIVVTGDSVSMCSEACATHKPVYIFVPPHLKKDAASFREALFAHGMAKPHIYPIRLDWVPTPMPDAGEAVAHAIRTRLFAGQP